MADIQKVSHTHDQIMNWLIANPEKSNRECADYFGYTQTWLSSVIHSDAFQAKFKERQDAVFSGVMRDTTTKLAGLADLVTEQLAEQLEKNQDKDFTLDAFDKIMHRSGYAPNSSRNPVQPLQQQQNNFFISKDILADARAVMQQQLAPPAPKDPSILLEATDDLILAAEVNYEITVQEVAE